MSSKLPITFFIILLSLLLVATAIPGGRTKVKNVKTDTEIQQLGSYSVDEYNRLQRTKKTGAGHLKFSQVVAAETQVVAGTKYYLKIEAVTKGGKVKVFDAEVVVQSWKHSKKLLGFKPAPVDK
ncbi:putative Cystatin domain-containing protein [Helianthus annuus]|nr:putative Cystatin domain-containing protein [Helianthus annuus]